MPPPILLPEFPEIVQLVSTGNEPWLLTPLPEFAEIVQSVSTGEAQYQQQTPPPVVPAEFPEIVQPVSTGEAQ